MVMMEGNGKGLARLAEEKEIKKEKEREKEEREEEMAFKNGASCKPKGTFSVIEFNVTSQDVAIPTTKLRPNISMAFYLVEVESYDSFPKHPKPRQKAHEVTATFQETYLFNS
ncbi:unnamed protein product [Sphenostylis stenocarpa]|uniref:Uncharacterized protein n=1 Tax=Sphenostylis stenocarpa TaxID=92480 RepID=A0AA86SS95_9FABA|nr:unnamed protein product [Sphenostylis stenocarpa]